jgi:hypothetical protein
MTGDQGDEHRPLPVVLRPVADELLSSWLARHAAYYAVTGPYFAKWLTLGRRRARCAFARVPIGARPANLRHLVPADQFCGSRWLADERHGDELDRITLQFCGKTHDLRQSHSMVEGRNVACAIKCENILDRYSHI